MKDKIFVSLAAVFLLAASGALAGTITAENSRIVQVTVFPDRAEVVREVVVSVPAGTSTIEFPGLPPGVESDSVRVSAKGVPAVLGAIEHRTVAGEPVETPKYKNAEKEVRRIESEIAELDAQDATAKEVREFVNSLRAGAAERESDKILEGTFDPTALPKMVAAIKSSLSALDRERLERAEKRQSLREDLEVARAKLATERPSGAIQTRLAAVEVEAERAGTLTVRLAYVARQAYWRPAYRASLDAGTGEVNLVSEAIIRQRTGEDWTTVDLGLSTASPARGVKPPRLDPVLLRPVMRERFGYAEADDSEFSTERIAVRAKTRRAATPEEPEPEPPPTPARRREASITRSAYNVAFKVPGLSDVPADGSDHKVVLRQETLQAELEYRAAPALRPAAYLVANANAPSAYPLLAGPVRVFAAGAFLGSFDLPEKGPGADLELPFGVDNRIEIERTVLPQDRSSLGFIGKDLRVTVAFRTTVENRRDREVHLVVEEPVPVSEDERIRVEIGKRMTPGSKEDPERPGIHEWTLNLAPGEKREILVEYSVRYPKDLEIPGLP